jgi:hypothetical protein
LATAVAVSVFPANPHHKIAVTKTLACWRGYFQQYVRIDRKLVNAVGSC